MRNDLSSYFEEPEFKQLLTRYEGMIKNHTPIYFDAEELTELADYYIFIGNEEEADKIVEYSLKLYPNNTDAMVYKVRNLYFSGNKEEAYRLMEQIEDPTDREVMFLKAELLTEEKKYREAELIYEELAEAEGESIHILRDIVLCYMDTNNKEYSRLWLSKIEKKGYNQENSQIYRDLWCDFCMTYGNPTDAIQAFQISVDEHPYSIKHWNAYAKCHLALLDFQKAHDTVDFSLAIDENNQEARELKAFCYMQEENYDEAITIYEQLLLTACNNKDRIYSLVAQCYLNLGEFYSAINRYLDWIQEYPQMTNYEKSEIYSFIAMCYCNLEIPDEGLKYIDMSLEFDPLYCGAIIQKATLLHQLGDISSAELLFQDALNKCSDDEREDIFYAIANSYFFLKQWQKVIEWTQKIIVEFPLSHSKCIVLLAYCYFELKNYAEGIPYLIESIKLHKNKLLNDPKAFEILQVLLKNVKERNKDIDLDDLN